MTRLTYATYLQAEKLLSLQTPLTPETADRSTALAEQFFIIAHQACELWVKQILADLHAATDAMRPERGQGGGELAAEFLGRAAHLLRLLHDQVLVVEKMPLRHFAEFRPHLGTASGAQSTQFHQLDALLRDDQDPDGIYQAFVALAHKHGTSVAEVCGRGTAVGVLHRLAEALIDIGNAHWRWKVAHISVISAMLNDRQGTGATNGVEYLIRRTRLPFPELRRLRAEVHHGFARIDRE